MNKKKVAYLGAGAWGYTLANLLASNGFAVTQWDINTTLTDTLQKTRIHPKMSDFKAQGTMLFTSDFHQALEGADLIVESVTSQGMRPVFERLKKENVTVPIVLTSKGIEQNTGLLLSEVALEVLGDEHKQQVVCLSGPSLAIEVMRKMPTSVVCSSYNPDAMKVVIDAFTTDYFRVYPNSDMPGVSFGGAVKNIIAIACGIADGLGFGDNTKAALMTRGLHEIRKLAVVKGCNAETINGLSGMGDLCVTCLSTHSRNYKFGNFIAEGLTPEQAKEKVGMVVEGAYTCVSALQLGKKHGISLPITEAVYRVLNEGLDPKEAVKQLLTRTVKQEHL
ncbi:MAG: NAD(P)-dependent glycerol-3-phosphate dehydrogenase [Chlamydiia bacterium]|nr:NAD(P)-dependent glycerol-3-phosphate dehydrogenase [Chlamydiia bacterium]MCP5509553.1 NAD(P)-dependent glycerol-3-phosphate dehydrogenase [Chlamydiales bacterium]HPE85180.1 NAD(P)H-dependent glycerol-3-phosphate dehydrogenase [Chlamydiales bacterium]